MEPFGAFAGAVNCIDVGVRVSNGLAKFIEEAKDADTNAQYLRDKVTRLCDLLEKVRVSLRVIQSRHISEDQIWIRDQIFDAIERCRETLVNFEGVLNKLKGQQRIEFLRRALLARELNKLGSGLKRFEGDLETHWKAISILFQLFQCLQMYSHNVNSEILRNLSDQIQDGTIYLQQAQEIETQVNQNFPAPSRARTNLSQATTLVPEDSESTDRVFGEQEKGQNLKTLSDSISVAQKVFNRISRPGSSRVSVIDDSEEQEKSPLEATDAKSQCDEARPLETLNPLINNLSKHVADALHKDDLSIAERHQLQLIRGLVERRNVYGYEFDEYEAQYTLAHIYYRQERWLEHDAIHRQLLGTLDSLTSSSAQSQGTEPSTDIKLLECQSRSFKSLAGSLLNQCHASKDRKHLDEARVMALRSVKLKKATLSEPNKPNTEFGDTVRQYMKILQEQENVVEVDTVRGVYFIHLEEKPLSPPLTPSETSSDRKFSTSSLLRDPNAEDKDGFTPLAFAIHRRQIERINYLLKDRGADPERKCQDKTPLMHAVHEHCTDAILILHECWPELNLEEEDSRGQTALVIAAEDGDCEMIEALVGLGARLDVPLADGRTPLMCAAGNGRVSAVNTLLRHGHDCHGTDSDGWNSLHYAVYKSGGREVIERLITAGISVDSCCEQSGETALHIAVKLCDKDPVRQENLETLLANGAGMNLEDGAGNTPVSVAVENELEDVAELFFEQGAIYNRKPPRGLHRSMKELLRKYNQRAVPRRESSGTTSSSIKNWSSWTR